MADIKVKDLTDTSSITLDNQVMVLTNDAQNQVQNITVGNLLLNILSSDNGNVLEQGTDGKLYVETPENITGELSDLSTTEKSSLVAAINEVNSDLTTEVTNRVNAVSGEATIRANADNNLQTQIDAITAASDVTDIVGTYAELQAYDTTGLANKSVIKVLQDESRQNETTYYRWVITDGVGAWVLIGEEGPYYTISQADSKFATQETVGNLNNLATSDKSSVVNAMNELVNVLDPTQTADYIKNSKAIYSGEVSENALILPQIKEMAHSTFDSSKFTVVGTPNITKDGIASGFSGSNYLYKGGLTLSNNQTFCIKDKFNPTDSQISFGTIIALIDTVNNVDKIQFGLDTNANKLICRFPTSATTASSAVTNLGNITYNQDSDFEIKYDGTTLYFYVDGVLIYNVAVPNDYMASTYRVELGNNSLRSQYLLGSIDLKYFSITVDGVEVFNGNRTGIDFYTINGLTVSIPYTLSKTGSKIVDSAYRTQVASVYNEFGYANYYTLDEDNGNFTLPQGELYGLIENAKQIGILGQIVQSPAPLFNDCLHLLDGSVLSGSGSYGAFVSYIAGLYTTDPTANYFTTEANWQSSVSTYGVCGKFVYDSVNNTVRLPKYSNKIYTLSIKNSAPVVGNGMTLGLTNGTQNLGLAHGNSAVLSGLNAYGTDVGTATTNTSGSNKSLGITTDATKSGILAQLSDITTPLDGYYYIVVATSTKTQIQVDIDEIATDLNGKADVDLANTTPAQSFKNSVMTWGMPDYDNGISIDLTNLSTTNTNFTVPANGFIRVKLQMSNAQDAFFVDDKAIFGWNSGMSLDGGWSSPIPIYSGTHTFRINSVPSRAISFIFYPMKGVN